MASVTVALKDNDEGEWYSFLLSPEEETRLSQDPTFVNYLLNSVKKNKVTVLPPSTISIQDESVIQKLEKSSTSSPKQNCQIINDDEDQPHEEEENEETENHSDDIMEHEDNVDSEEDINESNVEDVLSVASQNIQALAVASQKIEVPQASTSQNIATVAVDDQTEQGDLFEHRFVWTYPSVRDLIALVRQNQSKFANPVIKRKNIWREIGKNMFEKGYPVTSEFCERKWRNLRGTYKAILFKCQKNHNAKKNWEFFQSMHEIHKDDPNMNPAANDEEPTPTTIRVVSAGGATYHIIEQASHCRPILPAKRKKVIPGIQEMTSLRSSAVAPSVSVIPSGQSILLSAEASKAVTATSAGTSMEATGPSVSTSVRRRRATTAATPSGAENEPDWFLAFKKEMRETNERNLQEIRAMHDENIRVLKERNVVMKGFLRMLNASLKDNLDDEEGQS